MLCVDNNGRPGGGWRYGLFRSVARRFVQFGECGVFSPIETVALTVRVCIWRSPCALQTLSCPNTKPLLEFSQ